MGMNEGISIKHGCNTNWDTEFKIYLVPKSIPAGKSQNFVDISGVQKPTRTSVWNLLFFFLFGKTSLHRYYQNKNQLVVTSFSYINLTIKLLIRS